MNFPYLRVSFLWSHPYLWICFTWVSARLNTLLHVTLFTWGCSYVKKITCEPYLRSRFTFDFEFNVSLLTCEVGLPVTDYVSDGAPNGNYVYLHAWIRFTWSWPFGIYLCLLGETGWHVHLVLVQTAVSISISNNFVMKLFFYLWQACKQTQLRWLYMW